MEEIFKYRKNESEDYYKILGCDQNSTIEQINCEYKIRALQFHPDKNYDDSKAKEQFVILQRAKEVLTDTEKRRVYDQWKNSGISMGFEKWLNLGKNVHNSMHWMGKKKTEPMVTYKDDIDFNYKTECQPTNIQWERESPNDVLRKFRNYEI